VSPRFDGPLANGTDGISDIEGKVARVATSECGQRASFNWSQGDASDIDGQTERSNGAGAHESKFSEFNSPQDESAVAIESRGDSLIIRRRGFFGYKKR
jgi:hypothetical protein